MKVAHIFNEINFSGAEIMYANASGQFQDNGFELIAISTGNTPGNFITHFENAGIKVFHKPFSPKSLNLVYIIRYLSGICRLLNQNNIDVIHIHRSNVFWYFSLCGYISGKRNVMTLHNVFKAGKITWFKNYLTRLTARLFFKTVFQSIGESVYANELNYFKNPTVLINNWYNEDKFFPPVDGNERQTLRKKLDIDKNSFVVISTGSCTAIKNHSDIIRAIAAIKDNADFTYLHLGTGILENEEHKLSKDLEVGTNIRFLGNKDNVRDYLIAADVFVMTSKFEGLSIAAIEAMGCGLPVILYNNPGLRDLIQNDNNGFLISQTYRSLADAILELHQHPLIKDEKGLNALEFVKQNYQMSISVNKIIQLYRQ